MMTMATTKTKNLKPLGGSVIECPRCHDDGWINDGTPDVQSCPLCPGRAGVLALPLTFAAWDGLTWEENAELFDPDPWEDVCDRAAQRIFRLTQDER